MSRNYTIDLLDNSLSLFFNSNRSEPVICEGNFCCFSDWIASDISSNNLDKCFYSICNESNCKVFKGNNKQYQMILKKTLNRVQMGQLHARIATADLMDSYCKIFKDSNKQFKSKKNTDESKENQTSQSISASESTQSRPTISVSSQGESNSSKLSPSTSSSYCKVFKGNNKRYKSRPNESNPKEYNIDLSADDFKKDFKHNLNEQFRRNNKYFCFRDNPISCDINQYNLNKSYYNTCNESYCKIFKESGYQFESKLDESESNPNELSLNKRNPSTSSVNNISMYFFV
ncbi:hypothetical protein K502DRAFT_345793 [Neoconidiobolus thromboides FSU 785]|nr:hypothetical protein K502DRAFT_345793 [Neoconidiobolus thromboides FSU 785]